MRLCEDIEAAQQSYEVNRAPENWGGEGRTLSSHPRIGKESVYTLSSCQQLALQVNAERIFRYVEYNYENLTTLMWPGSHTD